MSSPFTGSVFQWTVPCSGWWLSPFSSPSSPSSSTRSSATSLGGGPTWLSRGLSFGSHLTPSSSNSSGQSRGERRRQRDASHGHETLTLYCTTAPAQTVAYSSDVIPFCPITIIQVYIILKVSFFVQKMFVNYYCCHFNVVIINDDYDYDYYDYHHYYHYHYCY